MLQTTLSKLAAVVCFGFFLQASCWANCEISSDPPTISSPPEFTKPVIWYRESAGVRFSWQSIPGADGFFIYLCHGDLGFNPIAAEYKATSIALKDFVAKGEHVIRIKAYVNVDGNYIFNQGKTVKFSIGSEDLVQEPSTQRSGSSFSIQ